MKSISKISAAIVLGGALAMAAVTPGSARSWHRGAGWAAVGAGVAAGAIIGAAAANNGYYYGNPYYGGPYYGDAYAYEPGYAAPAYSSGRYYQYRNQAPSTGGCVNDCN